MIGVFGGTFDPPHLGHLILAERAAAELDLETVLWLLTPHSPLKPDDEPTPVDTRVAMVEAAIADNPRFRLSRVDLDRDPPYYAADSLERLQAALAPPGLVYLMGSDALADLPRWHDPERFVERCTAIGVMRRQAESGPPESIERAVPGVLAKVRPFLAPLVEISARDIRRRVAQGLSVRYLVPEAVRRIILAEGLYRA
jgi:nicotinate-nucleotide adenylyltransferase